MIYIVKRTQLYLDEAMAKKLVALSRQKGTTISELVRESVREKYMTAKGLDKGLIARQLTGIWAGRKDLARIESVLRKIRKENRLKRLRRG
jgi:DNA-binding GntR family transcriptional regulator